VLSLYLKLTRFLGERRRFVRRVAGLSLILLGVHAAADRLDDVAFRAVDDLDRVIDHGAFALLDGLARLFESWRPRAHAHAESFANFIDVAEKERVAVVLALLIELLIALVMLDFAWGKRATTGGERRIGVVEEIKESFAELKTALWPVDLERLAIVPILLCFTMTATLLAGGAIEQIFSSFLSAWFPLWPFGVATAAFGGLIVALLLAWRFLPDLLHGAILRAHERADHFRTVDDERLLDSKTIPVWRRRARRAARGAFLFAFVMPIAIFSVVDAKQLFALIDRAGALP
jgi:hypothetical protein